MNTISFDNFLRERMPEVPEEANRVARWRDCVAAMPGATADTVDKTIAEQRRYGFNKLAAFYWADRFEHLRQIARAAASADISAKRRESGAKGNASPKREKAGTKADKRTGARPRTKERLTPILRAVAGLDRIS
jgi:hypothetical protein